MPMALLAGACVGIFTITDAGASSIGVLYVGVTRYSAPSRPTPTPIGSMSTDAIGRSSAPPSHLGVMSSTVAGITRQNLGVLRLELGNQRHDAGHDQAEDRRLHDEQDRAEHPRHDPDAQHHRHHTDHDGQHGVRGVQDPPTTLELHAATVTEPTAPVTVSRVT